MTAMTPLTLSTREVELLIRSLAESIEDAAECGEHEQAAELAALQRRLAKEYSTPTTH